MNPINFEAADLARQIAKIIKATPDKFAMDEWGDHEFRSEDPDSCNTPACIAGWAGRLSTMDSTGLQDQFTDHRLHNSSGSEWIERQGKRLNLTRPACRILFGEPDYQNEERNIMHTLEAHQIAKVLEAIAEALDSTANAIDDNQLLVIISEVKARPPALPAQSVKVLN